jgi:ATP:ADP antiporter, AAA family
MPRWWRALRSGTLTDRLFGVAPRDRHDATVGFATLFLAMAGHGMMEAARDTLFLQTLPATRLPWAYLAIALLTLTGGAIQRRFSKELVLRRALRATLLIGAGVSLVFALTPSLHVSEAALLGFYTWTGLFATTIVVQFWLLAGTVMDFGQAKRAFALIGAGGLLGALSGSIAAASAVAVTSARVLPIGGALLFAIASFVPRHFSPARTSKPLPARQQLEPPRNAKDPYLVRVLSLVLLSTVTVTLVDYLFKSTVARAISKENLGTFISSYYVLLNAAALTVELFVTPRLLQAAGLHRVVLVMPLVLLSSSIGFAVFPTLASVLVLRGGDGTLRHSLNRVGIELLHLPLTGELRARMRMLAEAAGLRAGQALASLLVLASVWLDVEAANFAWVPVVVSVAWLFAALRIEPAYVTRLQRGIGEPAVLRAEPAARLDTASEQAIVRALGSESETEVSAALEAILTRDRPELLPLSILAHPSPSVVVQALEAHWDPERHGTGDAIARLASHENAEIRASALRWLIPNGVAPELLAELQRDSDAAVRATALVARARSNATAPEALLELERLLASGEAVGVRALARSLHLIPPSHGGRFALSIASGSDTRAIALAAEALAKAPGLAHLPAFVLFLAEPEARRSARSALVALGRPALDALGHALRSQALPAAVLLHVPRTIARFGTREAVVLLERALAAQPEEPIAFKLLRGLGRLRTDHPELPVDRDLLETDALRTLRVAVAATCWRRAVEVSRRGLDGSEGACAELLSSALSEEVDRSLERVFRVMHILEPGRSFRVVFAAIRSEDSDVRARGREMLQHVAPSKLRRALLALLDEGPLSVRLRRPLGFDLAAAHRRALCLARPRGSLDREFGREAIATLSDCLESAGREVKPLLRTLASTYARTLEHLSEEPRAV